MFSVGASPQVFLDSIYYLLVQFNADLTPLQMLVLLISNADYLLNGATATIALLPHTLV